MAILSKVFLHPLVSPIIKHKWCAQHLTQCLPLVGGRWPSFKKPAHSAWGKHQLQYSTLGWVEEQKVVETQRREWALQLELMRRNFSGEVMCELGSEGRGGAGALIDHGVPSGAGLPGFKTCLHHFPADDHGKYPHRSVLRIPHL